MEIELVRDDGGFEYTEHVPEDYPELAEEPECWEHHSNACGCQMEEQEPQQYVDAETGQPFPPSTEPPFPAGWGKAPTDVELIREPPPW